MTRVGAQPTARGVVFALAGVLVIEAAITYQPSKADDIDKALLTLRGPSIRAIPARQTQSADPATRPMSLVRVGGVQMPRQLRDHGVSICSGTV